MPLKTDSKAFDKALDQLRASLTPALTRAMEKSVEDLKRESEALAPFKTGALVGSVETNVEVQGQNIVGSVTYNVPYAAVQHNDMSLRPGPGTAAKAPTKYGVPGANYLLNPAEGLGRDGVYAGHVRDELEKG